MRDVELVPVRHGRMAASPWTYFRGAAAVMAADLASRPHSGLTVQLCGDAHVLNFGLWATPERQLSFDLRDFDETLPGPFEWDVLRLAASLARARARIRRPPTRRRATPPCTPALDGYRTRMRRYADRPFLDIWYDQITADELLDVAVPEERQDRAAWVRRAGRASAPTRAPPRSSPRSSTGADASPRRRRSGFATTAPTAIVRRGLRRLPRRRCPRSGDTCSTATRSSTSCARWSGSAASGCGCTSCCCRVRDRDDLLFLQIKQAGPSVYEAFLGPSRYPQPRPAGDRRQALHPERDRHLRRLDPRPAVIDFYVRQFRDMKVVPSGEEVAPWLGQFALKCGRALARAHATTGDAIAIDAYLGRNASFTTAMVRFARAYARQNRRDHAELVAAVRGGAIDAAPGW